MGDGVISVECMPDENVSTLTILDRYALAPSLPRNGTLDDHTNERVRPPAPHLYIDEHQPEGSEYRLGATPSARLLSRTLPRSLRTTFRLQTGMASARHE